MVARSILTAMLMVSSWWRGTQSVEHACERAGRTTVDGVTVRTPWTPLRRVYDDVEVRYCVLRGDDAAPEYARGAEIVQFALVGLGRRPVWRWYAFDVQTSRGRTLRQGPLSVRTQPGQLVMCRLEVCQFFTEPGEVVSKVSVETFRAPQ
ncbi:MAG TPA: hypothetical protein VFQ38_23550 [Longimicrobiales bacterium]|nr:hypothetical protein [Longimicrobiales bacterium]